MESAGARLRALLGGDPFVAGDCNSALTGRILQDVGFPAVFMSGHSTGLWHYAIPDYGVFTTTEMIEQAARVVEAIDIPVIVDADEAGDSIAAVFRTIRRYEHVGVAGVHVEDETGTKHTTYDGPLLSIPDMQARIDTAVSARRSDDFVVIARTNELMAADGGGTGSLDETIRRAIAYQEAGADAFIPAAFASDEQIAAIASEITIPLGGYRSLQPGLQFHLSSGYATMGLAAVFARFARHVLEHGGLPPDFDGVIPNKSGLIEATVYDDLVRQWAERTNRPTREIVR